MSEYWVSFEGWVKIEADDDNDAWDKVEEVIGDPFFDAKAKYGFSDGEIKITHTEEAVE